MYFYTNVLPENPLYLFFHVKKVRFNQAYFLVQPNLFMSLFVCVEIK